MIQEKTHDNLEYLNSVLRALRSINQLIVQEKDTASLIRKACEYITYDRVYHRATIILMNKARTVISTAEAGSQEIVSHLVEFYREGGLNACAQKALERSGVLGIHSPSDACSKCPVGGSYNGKGVMTVRLEHDDRVFGLLIASMDAELTTDPEQQDLFKNIANDIGFALHHIEQEKKRRRMEILQDAVYRISQAVESSENLDALYSAVHDIIRDVMPADNFYIAHYHEKDELLTFPYFVDTVDAPPKPRKAGRGLTEYVLRTCKSLLANKEVLKKLKEMNEAEMIGALSPIWLGVPLKVAEKPIGIIALQDYSNPDAYGERELTMLEYVSTQVAKAIQRKRAEDALRISEDLNRGIVANTPIGIMYLDAKGTIIYENPAMARITDVPEGEVSKAIGKRIQDIPDRKNIKIDEMVQKIIAGEPVSNIEIEYQSFYRKNITLKIHAAPRRDAEGKIIGAIVMCEDITDFKKLEAQFLQAQKMEAVGRLAGGVAHDFNNLLTVIFGHAELGMMSLDDASPVRKHLREIISIADRTTELIDQLLSFSRKKVIKPRIIDLNEHLANMERMLQRLIGEDVELTFIRKPALGLIKAEPAQVDQVVVNLAVNARDAMPEGGNLTIETHDVDVDASFAASHVGSSPGPYVQLSVSDSGHGIDKEIMTQIFDPFFTTKSKEKGTGLGLATVYGIVNQNGGFITCYSEKGIGTTFKIYLPRVEGGEEFHRFSAEAVSDPSGKETILVVEDEKAVRELAVETLRKFGYDVLESTNGKEALQFCRSLDKKLDLVLTDVVMPGLNGPEFVRQIRALGTHLKVLYMSGYTENSVTNRGILEEGSEYISKPFRPKELISMVRQVLDRK
jgi:PAS domain S-box-containing protein